EPALHHEGSSGDPKDGPSVPLTAPQGLRSSNDVPGRDSSMAAPMEKPQKEVPKTPVALPEVAAPSMEKPQEVQRKAPRQRASPAPAWLSAAAQRALADSLEVSSRTESVSSSSKPSHVKGAH
ncbi:unnamed protein product, partial [Symbiodinium microadriaticum]